MKDVAIIIINFNSSEFTLQCVDSVIEKTASNLKFQIIIVDNNSAATDFKNLKNKIPKEDFISLHRSCINTGFGGGNMFGTQFAEANYILFLNNDTLFLNDCLAKLVAYMDENPEIGVSTAQNYDENNKLTPSFDHNKGLRRLLFGRGFLEKTNPSRYPKRKKEYLQPTEADWVNGAFMFFRKDAFEAVGGFDTTIFLYWEEMDICHRLRKIGYKISLFPEAKILHYIGASTESSTAVKQESYISYLYVLGKNFSFFKYFSIRLYLFFVMLLKPKKWKLLPIILESNPNTRSLKLKQKITLLHSEKS